MVLGRIGLDRLYQSYSHSQIVKVEMDYDCL